jgi:hypothetical protein
MVQDVFCVTVLATALVARAATSAAETAAKLRSRTDAVIMKVLPRVVGRGHAPCVTSAKPSPRLAREQ